MDAFQPQGGSAVAGVSAAPFPIVLGTTGHRTIAPGAQPAIAEAIRSVLTSLKRDCVGALHVMSALAEGADQLVAEIAVELGIPTIAVLPMRRDLYAASISEDIARAALHEQCDAAILLLELPPLCEPTDPAFAERQFQQLGEVMARRSHLLLALWDGGEDGTAPLLGGTGDVVRMRLEGERPHSALRGSVLFTGTGSRLDLAGGGPVLQIVTPRVDAAPLPAHRRAGDCVLLAPEAAPLKIDPSRVLERLDPTTAQDIRQVLALNALSVEAASGEEPALGIENLDGTLGVVEAAYLQRLSQQQRAADLAAQTYQRKLFGEWVPAASLSAMWRQAWRSLRTGFRLRRPGVLFWFAAAVPVAVLAFEIYSQFGYEYWALVVYMLTFGGAMTLYHLRVRHHQWQNRFQDYRALAEALRVQLFWALCATPVAVADNYLRKQSREMGWIQLALRGPALWAAALALRLPRPQRRAVVEGWLEHQRRFFLGSDDTPGRATLNRMAAQAGDRWARRFLLAGLVLALAVFLLETVVRLPGLGLNPQDPRLHAPRHILLLLAAMGPALAGFFTISVEKRAYDAHADTYELMGRIFQRAVREADTPEVRASDAEFRALMLDLGREALSENAEWLLDHRHRPIESETG